MSAPDSHAKSRAWCNEGGLIERIGRPTIASMDSDSGTMPGRSRGRPKRNIRIMFAALVALALATLLASPGIAAADDYGTMKATCLRQVQKNNERRTQDLMEHGVTRDEECHATALIGLGQFVEAAEGFAAIARKVADEPQLNAFYLRLEAKAWIGGADLARAEATYDAAIDALPDWDVSRVERAVLRLHGDRVAEAAEDLAHVLDADPDNVAALMERGWLHRLTGNTDGARMDW